MFEVHFPLSMKSLLRSVLLLSLLGLASADPLSVPVWPDKEAPNGDGTTSPATTTLTVYQPEHPNGAAMIICPGGGYGGLVTGPEGKGIAQWLNQNNITGLVLEYRLPKGRSAVPLLDAQRAIRLARANSEDWKINPKRLGIIGFSAGGHLASTAITRFDTGEGKSTDPVQRQSSRPDFGILVYPVISMGPLAHGGSRNNLLGPNPTPQALDLYSSEKQVTAKTPPTFLAHALDDKLVSPENSRVFAAALKAKSVPVEYLELPNGGHGLSGYKGPSWDAWQAACLKWLGTEGLLSSKAPKVAPEEMAESGESFHNPYLTPSGRTITHATIISTSDPRVLAGLSPLNWIRTADAIHSPVCGASFKLSFADTKFAAIQVDTARLSYPSANRFPIIAWTVNNGPLQTHQLSAKENIITLSDSVANPVIDFYIKGLSPFEDRFRGDIPANALSITNFLLDPEGSILPAPKPAPLWLNLGDSILSGDGAALAPKQGRPANDLWAASDDARASYGYLLAQHYGYRESRLAFGGYAWTGGGGGNPPVAGLIDQITSTTSRLTGDKLVPCPDVILINLGENAAPKPEPVLAALNKLRLRTSPATKIIVMIPVSGKARTEVTAAVQTYLQRNKDAHTHLVDLGTLTFDTCDGQHPTASGHKSIYQAARPHFEKLLK
jgi:acetyl esterase/lipase